ncbi:RepB Plasmid Partition [Xenorhabdus bovienii str. oregonense]|uniref:RepB Plasmid Partition n=1 Tax=Xenorhabdus bovienii str. oregonense TaxID=1398202 RepID=A0A077P0D5_XENBV|nr:plasmid partitioning protein RepB C-terminal domain-containing protein [Xenorhabdus bovienii]CDH07947.1 RepB Plasmid Partition [Xenorhabdus bovienii str. oregonense]
MIRLCFSDKFVDIDVNNLTPSKNIITNVKKSTKYIQIKTSIKEIGIIEPIIVYPEESGKIIKILDGHLRVEAMKELGLKKIACLISTLDDAYTPNKHVNRLTIIQEQKMLKLALEKVSINKLSSSLGISIETLKGRSRILDGIDSEIVALLSDKHVPRATFDILKKMKSIRQIEVANMMVSFDNYSKNFALSLLNTTNVGLLVKGKEKSTTTSDARKNIQRLEKEMVKIQNETKRIEEIYGANTLKLVIAKSYIKKLLDNTKVLHWLIENNPDYLKELKKISSINSLDNK